MLAAETADYALFFHLFGAFTLVAGVAVAAVAFEAARRRRAAAEVALLLGLSRIGALLVAVGALVALVFGLWLVHLDDIDFGAGWISTSFVLFIAMVVAGAIGGRRSKRARLLAESGGDEEELHRLLDDRTALVLNYTSLVLAIGIIVMMVFKPGS